MTRYYRVTKRNANTGEQKTSHVTTGIDPLDLGGGYEERDGWEIVYPVVEYDGSPPASRAAVEKLEKWFCEVMKRREPEYRWRPVERDWARFEAERVWPRVIAEHWPTEA